MKKKISRRSFMKTGAPSLGALAVTDVRGIRQAMAASTDRARVFFTHDISAEGFLKVYSNINRTVSGRTGIKIHTGEPHGPTSSYGIWSKPFKKASPTVICLKPTPYASVHKRRFRRGGQDTV